MGIQVSPSGLGLSPRVQNVVNLMDKLHLAWVLKLRKYYRNMEEMALAHNGTIKLIDEDIQIDNPIQDIKF